MEPTMTLQERSIRNPETRMVAKEDMTKEGKKGKDKRIECRNGHARSRNWWKLWRPRASGEPDEGASLKEASLSLFEQTWVSVSISKWKCGEFILLILHFY
jgi:hypothetical protein